MIDLDAINLNAAKAHFALANVPMYIARKLREDMAIVKMAMENDSDVLWEEFTRRIENEPMSLREQVYPFALAVAVALKQDSYVLRKMRDADTRNFGWLREMITGLIEQQSSAATENKVGSAGDVFVTGDHLPVSDAAAIAANFSTARLG